MLVSKKCIIFWIFLEKYLLELLFNKTIIIQKKILSLTYFLSLDFFNIFFKQNVDIKSRFNVSFIRKVIDDFYTSC